MSLHTFTTSTSPPPGSFLLRRNRQPSRTLHRFDGALCVPFSKFGALEREGRPCNVTDARELTAHRFRSAGLRSKRYFYKIAPSALRSSTQRNHMPLASSTQRYAPHVCFSTPAPRHSRPASIISWCSFAPLQTWAFRLFAIVSSLFLCTRHATRAFVFGLCTNAPALASPCSCSTAILSCCAGFDELLHLLAATAD